jgi:hypothetical protein
MASINASTSGAGGVITTADNTGNLNIQSAGSTVLALTSSGTTITGTESVSGNLSFNSGYGSAAVAYGCRAWVNFNGTGTPAIRASGNVTSITDNGVGNYTINLTNAMPDANYSVSSIADDDSGNNAQITTYISATTSTFVLGVWKSGFGRSDPVNCCVAIFR